MNQTQSSNGLRSRPEWAFQYITLRVVSLGSVFRAVWLSKEYFGLDLRNGRRQKPWWKLLINIKPRPCVAQRSVSLTRQNKRRILTRRTNHRVMRSLLTACSALFSSSFLQTSCPCFPYLVLVLLYYSHAGVTCIKRRQPHLILCTNSINKDNEWHAKDPCFCPKRCFCQVSPKNENSHMASSHLHSLILLCSISLLDCFYQRSNEEGVYSCWKVVPFSVEPRRMVGRYSGEPPKSQSLKMEVEVLKFFATN